jgi:chromosome partitioning protein
MKTLAVVNQKGGCGKTTVAVNLAACIAASGKKVLIVDMDPQGHVSLSLGIDADQLRPTLYNALVDLEQDACPISETLIETQDDLWVAPSNILLSAIEQRLAGKDGREDRLRDCLEELETRFEFCIIDCPPSVGILTMNALRASQAALIPIDMSQLSLHGLHRLMDTINVLCARTSHSLRARIVANAFDRRARIAERILATLREDFSGGICSTVIHGTIKLSEAAMRGVPIRKLAPYSTAHEDFADLALEIMDDTELFDSPEPFPAKATFSYFDPGASEVIVAGDFNDWLPSERFRLKKRGDGNWTLRLPLAAGEYHYKFIVDGRSREDPSNPQRGVGKRGQVMSVMAVGRGKSSPEPA